ncbi:MAG: hypothetical protein NWE93_02050 [Candidatus Bathyarchaeota archaeon]|nr:hypothetical protein [Candidatus Bathyarchaeota archaeon]
MKLHLKILSVAFLVSFAVGFTANWQFIIDLLGLNTVVWGVTYGYFFSEIIVTILLSTVTPLVYFYWIGKNKKISMEHKRFIALWIGVTYVGYLLGVMGSVLLYHKLIYPYDLGWYISSPEVFVSQLLFPCLAMSLWSLYMFFVGFFGLTIGSNKRQEK